MIKPKYLLPIGISILTACQNSLSVQNIEDYFPVTSYQLIQDSIKIESEEIKQPVNMYVYNNILFLRNFKGPHFISIFDLNSGKFIKDIAPQGVGPEEFIMINSLSVDDLGIHFFDAAKKNKVLIKYKNNDFSTMSFNILSIEQNNTELCLHSYLYPIDSIYFFTLGLYNNYRCMLIDSLGKISNKFGQYPNTKAYTKYSSAALAMGNQGLACASDNGNYIAIANLVGGMLQIYHIGETSIPHLETEHIYFPSYFKDESNESTIGVSFSKGKNITGALGIQYYNNNLLVLFSGNDLDSDSSFGNKLLIYSEKGEPQKCITLSKECSLFSIDSTDGNVYFLSVGNNEDYIVYKLHIQDILKN